MQHAEGRFDGVGGVELYSQEWRPESTARSVVVLVHGVGEHSGRYMNVVRPLVEGGHAVYSYDHRGHGRSAGRRVHIDGWSQYRADLSTYLGIVAQQEPDRPIVLYGHSMGSLVVLDYLLQGPDGIAGAIISGVALQPVGVGSPLVIAMAKALSGVVPKLSVDLKIDAASLTRDPEALAAFREDPLVESKATVRWGSESLKTVDRITGGMGGLDWPMLVVHGGSDPLNLAEGAHALYEAVPHADKTLRVYPGVLHEPHNDLGHSQLAADIAHWLDQLAEKG